MARSFQERIAKIKLTGQQIQLSFHRRKNPKSTSFNAGSKEQLNGVVSISDIDRFLFENFRSTYAAEHGERISAAERAEARSVLLESPKLEFPPPENLCRSDRFFVSCGSSSSLITDEISSSSISSSSAAITSPTESSEEKNAIGRDDYVALATYSSNPYRDFRQSMQEMVEARREHAGKVDWQFLEELVFCYLHLNKRKSYGFILRAFVDLVVDLRKNSGEIPAN